MVEKRVGKSQLRTFGFIVGGGFTVIALIPMVFRGDEPRLWALVLAFSLVTTGLILPQILRPVYKGWMAVGEVLGWVNTRLILTLLFYVLIVPIALLLRLARKDLMLRHFDKEAATYRVLRTKRPASHMQRQY